MLRCLIVLPTYDEAANVAAVLQRIRAAAPAADVLVVDDASPDGTAAMAEAVAAESGHIEVLRRPGKAGLGSAYRDGFRWALDRGYEVIIEMDADMSHDPSDLPRLIAAVEDGADLAIGARYVPGGSIPEWSWHRRLLSRQGNRYAAWALRLPISDATSGFRAYRASTLDKIDLTTVRADGYGFQVEMAYQVAGQGGVIVEVPIRFSERTRGRSKMSSRIVIEALVLVTWWGVRDRFGNRGQADQR
ncbi:MAG: dolichol-phosphate mannosyltransferase [Acidimicrobiaceae bacterium]|nr:dolichol-phosphate mannosyltransferase [Acidimicrobiaceae bacterium]MDQ1399816.1 dolichol-phosphate mannosyltransferase [Acidimicrobiaceae bacterium]